MQMVLVPMQELESAIINCVNICLRHYTPSPAALPTESDEIFDIKEAAVFTKLSQQSIYRLHRERKVPCFKKGKRLLFSKNELTSWIKTSRSKTLVEMESDREEFLGRVGQK